MRWVLPIVFGVIGGAFGYAVFGDPTMGGELGRQVAVFSVAIGFVLAAPIGFLIGSLPISLRQPAEPDKPPKRLSLQVAGMSCAICGETIIFAGDGTSCRKCERVYHLTCAENGKCPSCS